MEKTKSTTPRKPTRRKRHAEVVEAAARVFNAKGYEGTSIQDIADELGILKGSVYYYITSKEDILYEVLEEVHRAGFESALGALKSDAGTLEQIHSFVSTLGEFNAENRMRMAILLREVGSLSQPRRREIIRERDRYDEILRDLITEGQDAGLIAEELDAKIATLAIMGMINNIYQWYKPSGGFKPSVIGRMYGDLAIRALSGKPLPSS